MAISRMGAILILSILVFLGAVGARESSSVDMMGPAVKHWEKRFPGVVLPTPLREAVSPVEGSVLAALFATHIQHGSFNPSTSSSFCKTARLTCDDETLHSARFQQQLNKGVDTYNVNKVDPSSNPLWHWDDKGAKVDPSSNPLWHWDDKGAKVDPSSNPLWHWDDKGAKVDPSSNPLWHWDDKGAKVDPSSNPLWHWDDKGAKVDPSSNPLWHWDDKGAKVDPSSNPLWHWDDKGAKVDPSSNPLWHWDDKGAKVDPSSNPLWHWDDKGAMGDDTRVDVNKQNKSPIIRGFFMESDLVIGATASLFDRPLIPLKPFIPRVVGDALPPIVPENLHKLQQIFNIEEGTEMYDAVAVATRDCGLKDVVEGEKYICAFSLESFADFMASNVGPDIKVLTNTPRDSYSVEGPMRVANFTTYDSVEDKINVAVCHILNFPTLMYMCHVQPDVKIVEAILTSDDDGVEIRATGMCHLDTKMWAPNHVSFRLLGTKPGTPVCHWNYQQDLILYATKTEESSVIHKAVAHGGHMAMDPIPVRDVIGM